MFKKMLFATCALGSVAAFAQTDNDTTRQVLQDVVVKSTKASKNQAVTFTNLSKKEIAEQNFGQDVPFLLNLTPSVVINSDAGGGIGYTGIRIRGTDPSRTNVTINGVPINDAESHGMFWVNMPDLASSMQSIQVQRGVGTSSNGAGAFGASINVQTDLLNPKAYAEVANSVGSFNTFKNTMKAGTGLLDNKWAFDARLSKITSDGFIDRSSSDLKSFFVSGAYYGEKSILKMNVFSGKEVTGQAWYGIPEGRLKDDVNAMNDYAINNGLSVEETNQLLNSGSRTYNPYTYPNQTDNYQQDYYQLFYTHQFSKYLLFNIGLHYTYGRGYYEEYRSDEKFKTYKLKDTLFLFNQTSLQNDTIIRGDFIRRRWLENDFYGTVFSLTYEKNKLNVTLGGSANKYDGKHFGELIWAQYSQGMDLNQHFYEGKSTKIDANVYVKAGYKITKDLEAFIDLQQRVIDYKLKGEDLSSGVYYPYDFNLQYQFFNPKAGVTYSLNTQSNVYAYAGMAGKEPIRNDIINATNASIPKQEQLTNVELGYRGEWKKYALHINFYYMDYKNQLIATGELNDVGAYNRVNVPESYRAGIELSGGLQLLKTLSWNATFTYSDNRIKSFTAYTDDYDNGGQFAETMSNKKIAFSPDMVASSQLSYKPIKNLQADFIAKYVSEQYLDNTQTDTRKLDAFVVNDLRLSYTIAPKQWFKTIKIGVLVNNLLDEKYEPNGSTFGWISGGKRYDYNFYFPQAGRNFMGQLVFNF